MNMDGQSVILASECEKRVAEAEQRVHDHYSTLAPVGYLLGLSAAREAVAGLAEVQHADFAGYYVNTQSALAAIDGLRGESNG